MIGISILAIFGVIAIVAILLLVIHSALADKPDLPYDLFADCRADLRQLQDWYFALHKYEDTEKVSQMLKDLDDLWAEYDMEQEGKGNDALSI